MPAALVYDLIGYLASSLIVLSLLMSSVLRLRLIGFAGAAVFVTYGLLIGAIPVAVTNGVVIVVHGIHLRKLLSARAAAAYFEILRWPTNDLYLPRFVAFHADDIARTQPAFGGITDDHLAYLVLRNAEPVGLVLLRHDGSGTGRIDLDYVTPPHRDFKAGLRLFDDSSVFADEGMTELVARGDTEVHRRYLQRMGFVPSASGSEWTRPVRRPPAG
jgi:hypothetical protein